MTDLLPDPAPKTFLVTGGCGFIGSHLCEALVARGHGVRVLDDLSSGHRANLAVGATLVEGSITDPAAVREALEGVDGCFHLAAIASVEQGVRDWPGTHRVNLTGTIGIFNAIAGLAASARVPVVYASSAAVYGDCETVPVPEDAEKRPLSAYGADKYGCELHARVARAVHGIPATGLRFFNVYGPRQDPRSPYSGVISIFADRLRRGQPVEIFGDGGQTRDFVFVRDVVAALMVAMARPSGSVAAYNVCTGQPTSVLELAETIAGLLGIHPDIRFSPGRAGEIRHSRGTREMACRELGLAPPTPLREGLAEVLAWLGGDAPPAALLL